MLGFVFGSVTCDKLEIVLCGYLIVIKIDKYCSNCQEN